MTPGEAEKQLIYLEAYLPKRIRLYSNGGRVLFAITQGVYVYYLYGRKYGKTWTLARSLSLDLIDQRVLALDFENSSNQFANDLMQLKNLEAAG